MNYEQYVKYQTEGPGMIRKPLRYRLGERRAIEWFFEDVSKDSFILDVGCGTGVGIKHLNKLGFNSVTGVELNTRKFLICVRKHLQVYNWDIEFNLFGMEVFDVIWASHSFEHMLRPEGVMDIVLSDITKPNAKFFFILPYPDTGPKEIHCASDIIGTRIDDGGKAVMKWFEDHGLEILDYRFDSFRENEIWLKMMKKS